MLVVCLHSQAAKSAMQCHSMSTKQALQGNVTEGMAGPHMQAAAQLTVASQLDIDALVQAQAYKVQWLLDGGRVFISHHFRQQTRAAIK